MCVAVERVILYQGTLQTDFSVCVYTVCVSVPLLTSYGLYAYAFIGQSGGQGRCGGRW